MLITCIFVNNFLTKKIRKDNSFRRCVCFSRIYCFFFSLLFDTLMLIYVTRLPLDVSKLWRFRRGFNFPSQMHLPKNERQKQDSHSQILYPLYSNFLSSTPKTIIFQPILFCFLHPSLRSIANTIQFRRREDEGGLVRRMEFDILYDATWKWAENRAWWHVGNRSNRFHIFLFRRSLVNSESHFLHPLFHSQNSNFASLLEFVGRIV